MAALLAVAAAVLWHHLPVPTQVYAPFDVQADMGNPVSGRALAVTASRVRVGPKAKFVVDRYLSTTITATGVWVVVDAAVSATYASMTPSAELLVGANSYQPSTRIEAATAGLTAPVEPGIPQRGSWAFDVATEFIEPSLTTPFQLRVWTGDGRLDSRLAINLRAPEHVNVVTVEPPEASAA
jgi:hypothetical protein